jgi:methylated-DNA-[protein]-cysteine S-methyltransferase
MDSTTGDQHMTTALARDTRPPATIQSPTCFARMSSPVGPLLLIGTPAGDETRIRGIYFDQAPHAFGAVGTDATEDVAAFSTACMQLNEYFSGIRQQFELPLAPVGTPFQLRVWQALATIPYGQTMSYRQIAEAIGRPEAARAVGAANGRNPLSIVVPCHRVIGNDGQLTGYAGGLAAKRCLLELELAHEKWRIQRPPASETKAADWAGLQLTSSLHSERGRRV